MFRLFILSFFVFLLACGEPNTEEPTDHTNNTTPPPSQTLNNQQDVPDSLPPHLDSIRQLLIGTWEEDTIAFKNRYNQPPPPAKNLKVRYHEDGFVSIPGVLLTPENWDKWRIVNDTTLHITKRRTNDVRVFIIDDISSQTLDYRMIISDKYQRVFRLNRIKE